MMLLLGERPGLGRNQHSAPVRASRVCHANPGMNWESFGNESGQRLHMDPHIESLAAMEAA